MPPPSLHPHDTLLNKETLELMVARSSCALLSRAWHRYLKKLHHPRTDNLTMTEFITFILSWTQHFQRCQAVNPFNCYSIFSSTVSNLLPISNLTPSTTLDMVIWRHLSTYREFLKTIHYLQIPLSKWNITFFPTVAHMDRGLRGYLLTKLYGLPSLYLSSSNPQLLQEQPFEVEITVDTEEKEESPTPSPPSTPTPSTSKNSYASHIFRTEN